MRRGLDIYIYTRTSIHARRLIIINPCLLPTVINLYSSPMRIPIPNPILAHGDPKASSSLIYACRINLYLFFLPPPCLFPTSSPPFQPPSISFHVRSLDAAEPVPSTLLDADPDNEGPALSCANIFLGDCLHRRGADTRGSKDEL